MIVESRNVSVKESDLLTPRGNSLILIHYQFPTERHTSKQVKPVDSVFDHVNLASCQGNDAYKLIGKKQEKTEICVTFYFFTIRKVV